VLKLDLQLGRELRVKIEIKRAFYFLNLFKHLGISTPGGDSIRTVRSRSFDPSGSPDCVLRRPSRIEHLSEIFRYFLKKII